MATVEDVRALALTLPRTTEHLVRDRVKFRVGSLVYLALDRSETHLGLAYPKDERDALVAEQGDRYLLPAASDLRYHWVVARLALLDDEELHLRVTEAWSMVVPRFLVRERLGG